MSEAIPLAKASLKKSPKKKKPKPKLPAPSQKVGLSKVQALIAHGNTEAAKSVVKKGKPKKFKHEIPSERKSTGQPTKPVEIVRETMTTVSADDLGPEPVRAASSSLSLKDRVAAYSNFFNENEERHKKRVAATKSAKGREAKEMTKNVVRKKLTKVVKGALEAKKEGRVTGVFTKGRPARGTRSD